MKHPVIFPGVPQTARPLSGYPLPAATVPVPSSAARTRCATRTSPLPACWRPASMVSGTRSCPPRADQHEHLPPLDSKDPQEDSEDRHASWQPHAESNAAPVSRMMCSCEDTRPDHVVDQHSRTIAEMPKPTPSGSRYTRGNWTDTWQPINHYKNFLNIGDFDGLVIPYGSGRSFCHAR